MTTDEQHKHFGEIIKRVFKTENLDVFFYKHMIACMEEVDALARQDEHENGANAKTVNAMQHTIDRLEKGKDEAYEKGRAKGREEAKKIMEDTSPDEKVRAYADAVEIQKKRIAELEDAMASVIRTDKTPEYAYPHIGDNPDLSKNNLGKIPEGKGERWLTPREIAKKALARDEK